MTAPNRPPDLPEVGRIAGRIASTLIGGATGANAQLARDGLEEIAGRIAAGIDAMYLGPYRALQDRMQEQMLDAATERDDLRVDAAQLLDRVRAWHDQQPDHQGWALCQHPVCRAIQEFPWE